MAKSSHLLNQNHFAADSVGQTIPETRSDRTSEREADAAITARAVVAVSLLGTGFWYLLWKLAIYLLAGH